MTIGESFLNYMENIGVGVPGQNIFLGETPPSQYTEDSIWWIIESGGSKITKAITGESIKQYSLQVFYRDRNYGLVSKTLAQFEEQVNCAGCLELEDYETLEVEVIQFPIDQDLDSEDRKVGLLQINIQTYKTCN